MWQSRSRSQCSGRMSAGAPQISYSVASERERKWAGAHTEFKLRMRRTERERERHRQHWNWFDDVLLWFGLGRRHECHPCLHCGRR